MEILDTGESRAPAAPGREGHVSIDQFQMTHVFKERAEEERAETAMALYEKAFRARVQPAAPDPLSQAGFEELEAMSQELKLRQKCQDIAARIMVDELEDELEDEE